jgi:hypothetical protein
LSHDEIPDEFKNSYTVFLALVKKYYHLTCLALDTNDTNNVYKSRFDIHCIPISLKNDHDFITKIMQIHSLDAFRLASNELKMMNI